MHDLAGPGWVWLTDGVPAWGCQVEAGRPHGVGSLSLGPAQAGVQYSGEWCHGQRHGKVGSAAGPLCSKAGAGAIDMLIERALGVPLRELFEAQLSCCTTEQTPGQPAHSDDGACCGGWTMRAAQQDSATGAS